MSSFLEGHDINDTFFSLILIEENLSHSSYKEGFQCGSQEGINEGYRLGYENGLAWGKELARIYGTIIVEQQKKQPYRVRKVLSQLRESIEEFPFENNSAEDIIGKIKNIRLLFKKILAMVPLASVSCNEDLSY